MLTVYKYPFPIEDTASVKLPAGAKILHIDWQGDVTHLMLWALVDPVAEMVTHTLHVRGTGHPMSGEEGEHLGTVLVDGGVLVWHIFEAKRDA